MDRKAGCVTVQPRLPEPAVGILDFVRAERDQLLMQVKASPPPTQVPPLEQGLEAHVLFPAVGRERVLVRDHRSKKTKNISPSQFLLVVQRSGVLLKIGENQVQPKKFESTWGQIIKYFDKLKTLSLD
ncbi:hypothetical protein EYF80_063297 [Liparis tanakae]|uniref:Uncharacterized protein n=1 Tax=Liparis tanakae TaxID=230148 RepID=A0A4Z2ECE2_9TELE|nr:hypothetical protein EYF80_063297 [Liparis tanakae]